MGENLTVEFLSTFTLQIAIVNEPGKKHICGSCVTTAEHRRVS
jgi:hypothetical protein